MGRWSEAPWSSTSAEAMQLAGKAAVQPQRDHVLHPVRGLAGADIAKAWQERGADHVAVAQDGGVFGQAAAMRRNCRRFSIWPCERCTLATAKGPRSMIWQTRRTISPRCNARLAAGLCSGCGLQAARP